MPNKLRLGSMIIQNIKIIHKMLIKRTIQTFSSNNINIISVNLQITNGSFNIMIQNTRKIPNFIMN